MECPDYTSKYSLTNTTQQATIKKQPNTNNVQQKMAKTPLLKKSVGNKRKETIKARMNSLWRNTKIKIIKIAQARRTCHTIELLRQQSIMSASPPNPLFFNIDEEPLAIPDVKTRIIYDKVKDERLYNFLKQTVVETIHMKKALTFPLADRNVDKTAHFTSPKFMEDASIILHPVNIENGFVVGIKLVAGDEAELVCTLDGKQTWNLKNIRLTEQIQNIAYQRLVEFVMEYGEPFEIFDTSIETACRMVEDQLLEKNHTLATGNVMSVNQIRWADSNRLVLFEHIYREADPEDIRNKNWDRVFDTKQEESKREQLLRKMLRSYEDDMTEQVELEDNNLHLSTAIVLRHKIPGES